MSLCTGAALVVQRFLLELLTKLGSIAYKPTRGTLFLTQLESGKIRTETDLFGLFALSEMQARQTLKAEESSTAPDNERYSQATLTKVLLSPGSAQLSINVQSLAGSTPILLPITV